MSYCPYCGAALPGGTISFCPDCGKSLLTSVPQVEEKKKQKKTKASYSKKKKKPPRRDKETKGSSKLKYNPSDEDYDGYYDDVLPTDNGEIRQGLDKDMVKRIAGLIVGVLAAIAVCVALMYLI